MPDILCIVLISKEQERITHGKDIILKQKCEGMPDILCIDAETNDVMTPRNMKEVKDYEISF